MYVTRISRYVYYPRFHVTAVGLGTYYPWIRGSACIQNLVSSTIESEQILLRTDAKGYCDVSGRCTVQRTSIVLLSDVNLC